MYSSLPAWLQQLIPIVLLLLVITAVIARLPRIDVGHSPAFLKRRFANWFPLGMTYAFLYMGRYNLTVSKNAFGGLMSNEDFGTIFAVGTITYGVSFVLNGPLTDRFGGRAAILTAAIGSALMNILLGVVTWLGLTNNMVLVFSLIYAANMYFQSFGAVAVVKVNASWFHLNERGAFGGIFGILISLGIYFAFDWGAFIVNHAPTYWVFFVPALILMLWTAIDFVLVQDSPGQAGHSDFDTFDATSPEDDVPVHPSVVIARMIRNPIILTIGIVEFCSGFLRNAIMHWYIIFAKQTGIVGTFVPKNWGMLLCLAGILGGMFAGQLSDRLFHSRRGPVAAILYLFMLLGSLLMVVALDTPALGWIVVFMSLCIIGVHGMLSGTASMDFGGRKNTGIAVGLIDGLVYLGTGTESLLLGKILPSGDAAKEVSNWSIWPLVMVPMSIIGLVFALRVWNAKPRSQAALKPEVQTATSR